MKCPYCNNEVTNTQDYCPNCGQVIKSVSEKIALLHPTGIQ